MEASIAADPEAHPVIIGIGGIRSKARWGRQGKGKSAGVRVIYYYWNADNEVYMLYVFAKKEQPAEFAQRYGLSVRTLQDWELGRTQPPSAVRAYLIVID